MNPPSLREICAKATKGPRKTSATLVYSSEGTICACGEPRKSSLVRFHPTEISSPDLKEQFANADLIARFSPATALAVYEALEGVLRVADRKTVEFDAVRRSIALLDGRTEP